MIDSNPDFPQNKALSDIAKTIRIRNKENFKKRVFISYPKAASIHAKMVKDKLENLYFLDEYQQADGNIIMTEVIKRIRKCDYFLGIWHHEESTRTQDEKFGISPWMPLELGIAISEEKEFMVILSEKLNDEIWKRIKTEKGIPKYNDDNIGTIIDKVVQFFKNNSAK